MARAGTKRDRLLEGEDPNSLRPQDTRHWISVYREMIAFKDDLLERVSGDLVRVSPAAKTDLNDDSLPEESLRTYISRVRKKLKELNAGAQVVNKSRKGYALIFKAQPI